MCGSGLIWEEMAAIFMSEVAGEEMIDSVSGEVID